MLSRTDIQSVKEAIQAVFRKEGPRKYHEADSQDNLWEVVVWSLEDTDFFDRFVSYLNENHYGSNLVELDLWDDVLDLFDRKGYIEFKDGFSGDVYEPGRGYVGLDLDGAVVVQNPRFFGLKEYKPKLVKRGKSKTDTSLIEIEIENKPNRKAARYDLDSLLLKVIENAGEDHLDMGMEEGEWSKWYDKAGLTWNEASALFDMLEKKGWLEIIEGHEAIDQYGRYVGDYEDLYEILIPSSYLRKLQRSQIQYQIKAGSSLRKTTTETELEQLWFTI